VILNLSNLYFLSTLNLHSEILQELTLRLLVLGRVLVPAFAHWRATWLIGWELEVAGRVSWLHWVSWHRHAHGHLCLWLPRHLVLVWHTVSVHGLLVELLELLLLEGWWVGHFAFLRHWRLSIHFKTRIALHHVVLLLISVKLSIVRILILIEILEVLGFRWLKHWLIGLRLLAHSERRWHRLHLLLVLLCLLLSQRGWHCIWLLNHFWRLERFAFRSCIIN